MAAPLIPLLRQQIVSGIGAPYAGGLLYSYAAGTSNLQNTWSDSTLTTLNANPVVADANGRFGAIYLDPALQYKFVMQSATGATVFTQDNVSTTGSATLVVLNKTQNYTVLVADGEDVIVFVDASGGAVTITLYTAVGNSGRKVRVKKTDTSANAVTIDPNGAETIDGQSTYKLAKQYDFVDLTSDALNWATIGSSTATYGVLTKSADYTVAVLDGPDVTVLMSAAGAARTVNLYTAAGNLGKRIEVKKTDSSINAVTLDANAAETIDGALTYALAVQYDAVVVESDGSNWQVIAKATAGFSSTYLSKAIDYTVAVTDGNEVLISSDATGAARTITLYAASLNAGRRVAVKKSDTSTNVVTVDANAAETIDGALTYVLQKQYDWVLLECDGTNWAVVAAYAASGTLLTKSVDYTVAVTDGPDVTVSVDASGAQRTITLYAAANNKGKRITVKKNDTSTNSVILDGNASETIDGSTTFRLYTQNDFTTLMCDGSNWIIVASSRTTSVPFTPQGRLTLESGVPLSTSDQTAKGTLYFTPYKGKRLCVFNTTGWREFVFSELSLALTLTSGNNYDVFVYDNAGTLTLEVLIWTNDTTRATALVTQDGFYVKSGATTRFYLGTIRASGANTSEDSMAKRFCWNYYNRIPRPMRVLATDDTWTYATATWRQVAANAAMQLDFVVGMAEVPLVCATQGLWSSGAAGDQYVNGIGLDSTTGTATGCIKGLLTCNVAGRNLPIFAHLNTYPGLGRHYATWLEYGGVGTINVIGDDGGDTREQSGIYGWIEG